MKILGHPIHIMLIHFPSALLPMDFVCSAIAFYYDDQTFAAASFYALAGGVMMGWVSIFFGAFDLIRVMEKRPDAMKSAMIHGAINTLVIFIYTIIAYIQYEEYLSLVSNGILLLLIKLMTLSFMIVGNYIGGSLILKHKVGVENE